VSYINLTSCPTQKSCPEHCPECLHEARTRFHLFHCFDPARVVRAPCRRLIPKVLVHLGYLRGLIYSSDKGTQGCRRTYIHFMERPPRLTCNPEGTQLYIIGGHYRVTPRGIEG
jgi:hypothetical protein